MHRTENVEDDEFEGYPEITWENGREYLRQNIYFRKDADGAPIWKDTYVYAIDGKR